MDLVATHPEEVQRLREAGYGVETDDELVAAFASRRGVSQDTARLVLADSDDVQTIVSE